MRKRWMAAAMALLALAAAGCSSKTSAPVPCDDAGVHLMALASDRQAAPGHYGIWLYDLDAQGFRLLRNLASPASIDSSPAISSDGELIAFVRADTLAPGHTRLLIYARGTCGFVSRAAIGTEEDKDPAFSGDALHLAFARDTLAHWRIRLLNAGGNLQSLGRLGADHPWDDWDPSPNQDGSLIAFVSNRVSMISPDGAPHVYVYNVALDSLLATPGLDTVGTDVDPSLTPDGRWLAFASNRAGGAGGYDIYLYDLLNHALVPVPGLNSPQDDRRPSIRPDGVLIAFESTRTGGGGKRDLWIWSTGAAAAYQGGGMASPGDDAGPSVLWP